MSKSNGYVGQSVEEAIEGVVALLERIHDGPMPEDDKEKLDIGFMSGAGWAASEVERILWSGDGAIERLIAFLAKVETDLGERASQMVGPEALANIEALVEGRKRQTQ